jgi:hypothetical protein
MVALKGSSWHYSHLTLRWIWIPMRNAVPDLEKQKYGEKKTVRCLKKEKMPVYWKIRSSFHVMGLPVRI